MGVLTVLVTRALGEDGGTEAGQLIIHCADPEREETLSSSKLIKRPGVDMVMPQAPGDLLGV